jgi:hypothetical protein
MHLVEGKILKKLDYFKKTIFMFTPSKCLQFSLQKGLLKPELGGTALRSAKKLPVSVEHECVTVAVAELIQ